MDVLKEVRTVVSYIGYIPMSSETRAVVKAVESKVDTLLAWVQSFLPIGTNSSQPPSGMLQKINTKWGEVIIDLTNMIIRITNGNNPGPNPGPGPTPRPGPNPKPTPGPNPYPPVTQTPWYNVWWPIITRALQCIVDLMKQVGPQCTSYSRALEADPTGRSVQVESPNELLSEISLKLAVLKATIESRDYPIPPPKSWTEILLFCSGMKKH